MDDIAQFHRSHGTWWISQSPGTGFETNLWADHHQRWALQSVSDLVGEDATPVFRRHVGDVDGSRVLDVRFQFQPTRSPAP